MKPITTVGLFITMLVFTTTNLSFAQSAQRDNAVDRFKEHVNAVVQKVKEAKTPEKKRAFLNSSLDKFLTAFEEVEKIKVLSKTDQSALNSLRNNITEKKNELNGLNGFKRVPDNQLNNFAQFIQQDLEQAQTITISLVVLLLIIIIVILIA